MGKELHKIRRGKQNRFFHISCISSSFWVKRINGAINGVKNQKEQQRILAELKSDPQINELGLSIATKLSMIPLIVRNVDRDLGEFGIALKVNHELRQCIRHMAAYRVDSDLVYSLISGLDSFVFECRSAYELIGKYMKKLHPILTGQQLEERDILALVESGGANREWLERLRQYRKELFHNLTPWIGVKVISLRPKRFEIFLLTENVRDVSKARGVIPFSDLQNIWQEFKNALGITQEYLIEKIRALDSSSV